MQHSTLSTLNHYRKPVRASTRAGLAVVLSAILLQSLFPSGYMAGNLASGWIATLCPDGLPATFVNQLNADGHDRHHHGGHAHSGESTQAESKHTADATNMEACQLSTTIDVVLVFDEVAARVSFAQTSAPIIQGLSASFPTQREILPPPRAPPYS